jgi:hypothetical protein
MPEYRGYVDPSTVGTNPTLDWNKVITGVQKTITDQEATREATRQKMETETNQLSNEMSKISTGQSQSANEFILNASYQSKKILNEAYKMYTSGQISKERLNVIKGNMSSMFSDVNESTKTLQADYAKYIEMSQKGELSAFADLMQETKGDAMNLSNKSMYIDPSTGRGYLTTTLPDGSIDKQNLQDPSWLKTNPTFFDPKVKVEEEINSYSKDIKGFTKVMGRPPSGGIWTVDDAVSRPGFEQLATKISNAIASNSYRQASILTDTIGGYGYGETAEDGKKIETKWNLSTGRKEPVITPKMKEDVDKAVRQFLVSQINYEQKQVEGTRVFAPREEKPTPVIPTTQDIKYSSSTEKAGKKTSRSGFTMDIPVIDKSTGAAQNLKTIYLDPESKELQIVIEEKNVVDGVTTVSDNTYSNKIRKSKEGKSINPDISKIDLIARNIYDPVRKRYLKGYKELYDYLEPQAQSKWETIQRQGLNAPAKTQTTSSGIKYTVE